MAESVTWDGPRWVLSVMGAGDCGSAAGGATVTGSAFPSVAGPRDGCGGAAIDGRSSSSPPDGKCIIETRAEIGGAALVAVVCGPAPGNEEWKFFNTSNNSALSVACVLDAGKTDPGVLGFDVTAFHVQWTWKKNTYFKICRCGWFDFDFGWWFLWPICRRFWRRSHGKNVKCRENIIIITELAGANTYHIIGNRSRHCQDDRKHPLDRHIINIFFSRDATRTSVFDRLRTYPVASEVLYT